MEILFDRNTAAVEQKKSPLRGSAGNFSRCKRDEVLPFFEVPPAAGLRKRKNLQPSWFLSVSACPAEGTEAGSRSVCGENAFKDLATDKTGHRGIRHGNNGITRKTRKKAHGSYQEIGLPIA
jgi:hypothetical protein